MLFTRKKRLQRDRDAGLVFCWRGQGGNRSGLILALLITSAIYTAAFWGLSLKFNSVPAEPKQSAKILLVDEFSSEMALWIDENTPFPVRWDPKDDSHHEERVSLALNGALQKMATPTSPWRPMPELEDRVSSPSLVEPGTVQLGNLPTPRTVVEPIHSIDLAVVVDALGDLKKRLPASFSDVDVAIPMQEYGGNLRFAVSLNKAGDVLHCAPVEWQSTAYAKGIENWLKVQKFKPSAKRALELGEVTIRVEAKNNAGN